MSRSLWKKPLTEYSSTIIGVTLACVALGTILVGIAIGWHAAWMGAVVAIPGALLASLQYILKRERQKIYDCRMDGSEAKKSRSR